MNNELIPVINKLAAAHLAMVCAIDRVPASLKRSLEFEADRLASIVESVYRAAKAMEE